MIRQDVFSARYLGMTRTRRSRLHPTQCWWGMYWAKGSICVHIWDGGKAPLGPIRSLNVALSFITHLTHYPFHLILPQAPRQPNNLRFWARRKAIIHPMVLTLLSFNLRPALLALVRLHQPLPRIMCVIETDGPVRRQATRPERWSNRLVRCESWGVFWPKQALFSNQCEAAVYISHPSLSGPLYFSTTKLASVWVCGVRFLPGLSAMVRGWMLWFQRKPYVNTVRTGKSNRTKNNNTSRQTNPLSPFPRNCTSPHFDAAGASCFSAIGTRANPARAHSIRACQTYHLPIPPTAFP